MRKKSKCIVMVLAGLCFLLASAVAFAEDTSIQNNAIAKKYLNFIDKFGNINGLKPGTPLIDVLPDQQNGLYGNQRWLDALAGKPDPKYVEVFKDLLTINPVNGKPEYPMQRANYSGYGFFDYGTLGLLLWKVPEAKDVLLATINKEGIRVTCGDKKIIVRTLKFLGDVTAVDAIIDSFYDDDYTIDHITQTLPVIARWNLSADQKAKLEDYCLKVFQGKASLKTKDKEKYEAVMRYLAAVGTANQTIIEYLKNQLEEGNKVEAMRALGGMGYAGAKESLTDILEKYKKVSTKTVKGKKQETTTWMARSDSVAAAFALANLGDASVADIIGGWTAVDAAKNQLADPSGFEMSFYECPFLNDKGVALLKPVLVKAYNALLTAAKGKKDLTMYVARVAPCLAGLGIRDGMPQLVEILEGSKKDHVTDVLNGLGGYQNYYQPRSGGGGVRFGAGKLTRADFEQLKGIILKRMEFWDKGMRELGVTTMLDMQGRLAAIGL